MAKSAQRKRGDHERGRKEEPCEPDPQHELDEVAEVAASSDPENAEPSSARDRQPPPDAAEEGPRHPPTCDTGPKRKQSG